MLFAIVVAVATLVHAQEPDREEPTNAAVQQFVDRALKANDKNGDGEITKDEAGQLLRRNFGNVDANKDGVVTKLS